MPRTTKKPEPVYPNEIWITEYTPRMGSIPQRRACIDEFALHDLLYQSCNDDEKLVLAKAQDLIINHMQSSRKFEFSGIKCYRVPFLT